MPHQLQACLTVLTRKRVRKRIAGRWKSCRTNCSKCLDASSTTANFWNWLVAMLMVVAKYRCCAHTHTYTNIITPYTEREGGREGGRNGETEKRRNGGTEERRNGGTEEERARDIRAVSNHSAERESERIGACYKIACNVLVCVCARARTFTRERESESARARAQRFML